MKFITFDPHHCDNCYKCLRVCPTKAIAFTGSQREIIDALCIKCGLCQSSCTQNALTIQNDKFKIRKALLTGGKIAVSLAPSYSGAFMSASPGKLFSALKQLGFQWIEETAFAAESVSRQYEDYLTTHGPENMITTSCPSANLLLELRYPELIPLMPPVVSPMIAHGRMLKQKLGPGWQVVFIGPCLAKKAEAEEIPHSIDYVLTFNELHHWFEEAHIDLDAQPEEPCEHRPTQRGAGYPLGGSLFDSEFRDKINDNYRFIRAEGLDRLIDVFEALKGGKISGYCIEMNMCNGSCVNGPDMPDTGARYYQRKDWMVSRLEQLSADATPLPALQENTPEIMSRNFHENRPHFPDPSPEDVKAILNSMGKYSEDDLLNCGACGYPSCKEKVVGIYRGFAEKTMCMPYMKSIAEGLQSAIFHSSPNPICILDDALKIRECNPAFETTFNVTGMKLKKISVFGFLPESLFDTLSLSEDTVHSEKIHLPVVDRTFLANVVPLTAQKSVICILADITLSEKQRHELASLKEETLSSCQQLIDKQMRMVQEIAGMLGESTAETKVSLNRLKTLVNQGEAITHDR